MTKAAHEFRGEYIDLCARIEHWLTDALKRDAVKSERPRKAYLFGQKIKATSDLANSNPEIFSKPERVAELLSQFQPYATLRSELAHAVVTVASSNETLFAFKGPSKASVADAWRFWITPVEAKALIAELAKLTKHICDQKLSLTPPGQPRPSPRGAAGP